LVLAAVLAAFAPAAHAATLAEVEAAAGPPPVPPGARYHAACSALQPGKMAVFTFDQEANPQATAALSEGMANGLPLDLAPFYKRLEAGAQGETVRRVEAFLKARGLKPASHDLLFSVYVQPGAPGRAPLEIGIAPVNGLMDCVGVMSGGPVYYLSAR
ncbi:hypothetical protein, partial [Caulobacter sp. 17J65-9]|uniref:hypothetical protein n=1 Tax=Caulobacter sp. 17J65-9 TaxID=2709382 RepID=UPI0013CD44C9